MIFLFYLEMPLSSGTCVKNLAESSGSEDNLTLGAKRVMSSRRQEKDKRMKLGNMVPLENATEPDFRMEPIPLRRKQASTNLNPKGDKPKLAIQTEPNIRKSRVGIYNLYRLILQSGTYTRTGEKGRPSLFRIKIYRPSSFSDQNLSPVQFSGQKIIARLVFRQSFFVLKIIARPKNTKKLSPVLSQNWPVLFFTSPFIPTITQSNRKLCQKFQIVAISRIL